VNLAEGKTIQRVEIVPVVEVIQAAAQILAQEVGWGQVGVNILNEDVIIHKVPVVPFSMIKYLLLCVVKKIGRVVGKRPVSDPKSLSMSEKTYIPKPQRPVRWLILLLACVMMIGNYYSYDTPAALYTQLKQMMGGGPGFDQNFNLLYTVYSIPNMVLPFFGGFFVDKLGAPRCLLIFCTCLCLGQSVFAIGATMENWYIMWLGRVIFGFGGESCTVAQSALLAQWFGGQELALAFGLNLSLARLGSVLNNLISPAVANRWSTPISLFVGAAWCGLSLVLALALYPIDRAASPPSRVDASDRLLDAVADSISHFDSDPGFDFGKAKENKIQVSKPESNPEEEIRLSDAANFGVMFWLLSLSCLVVYGCVLPFNNVASPILLERNYFKAQPEGCELAFPGNCTSGSIVTVPNPSTNADNHTCPGPNFQPILPSSIHEACPQDMDCRKSRYDYDHLKTDDVDCQDPFWADGCVKSSCDALRKATEMAGRVMSIPYIMSAVLSPFLGALVDRIGRRAIIALLAPVVFIAVHLSLGLTDITPVLPLVGQGLAYSCFGAVLKRIWTSMIRKF
jgi:MFS family permease